MNRVKMTGKIYEGIEMRASRTIAKSEPSYVVIPVKSEGEGVGSKRGLQSFSSIFHDY